MEKKLQRDSSSLRRFWQHIPAYRGQIKLGIFFSVVNKFFDIFPEILIGVSIDVVVRRQDSYVAMLGFKELYQQMIFLGVSTFLIWGAESIFQYLYSIVWRNLAQKIQHDLRLTTYSHIQDLDISFFETQKSGNLLSILNDDINQLERFLDNGANSVIQVITSTILVSIYFLIVSPLITVFAMLPIPVILIVGYFFQSQLAERYAEVRERVGRLNARLSNNILGIAAIKSYTTESYETAKLGEDSLAYLAANTRAIKMSSAFVPIIRMAIVSGFIVTLVLGGWQVLHGDLNAGLYSSLLFLTQRLLWPFTSLAETTDLYQRAMASIARIMNMLAIQSKVMDRPEARVLKRVRGEVELKQLSFSYGETSVFESLSLKIEAGHSIGIVGATGSGKSTLVKLLLRFYEINSGQILVDGCDIRDIQQKSLRQSIGYVSQDVFLVDGTIKENIAYGQDEVDMEKVKKAAMVAEIDVFINELPKRYDTLVGERGQKLSGGQRQRIAIARAIYKDPPILILDEATSAVDNETEAAIQRSLEKIVVDRTTLIIAHRLSTVRNTNHIFVLERGRIIESGTHTQLLEQKGLYANLWRVQTGDSGSSA